jgi:hypothetical protein
MWTFISEQTWLQTPKSHAERHAERRAWDGARAGWPANVAAERGRREALSKTLRCTAASTRAGKACCVMFCTARHGGYEEKKGGHGKCAIEASKHEISKRHGEKDMYRNKEKLLGIESASNESYPDSNQVPQTARLPFPQTPHVRHSHASRPQTPKPQ